MTINLDEITKALGEITQGEWLFWEEYTEDRGTNYGVKCKGPRHWIFPPLNIEKKDVQFIAHAPEWLRLLVEQHKAVLVRNEELQCENYFLKRKDEGLQKEVEDYQDKLDVMENINEQLVALSKHNAMANEELQRRVAFLEDVLSYIKDESPEMRQQVLEYEDKVRKDNMDAKEQDNDQAD